MSAPNSFDPSRAYVQQEEVFFNDGREAQLLRHVQSRKDIESLRGCPQKILDAIDEFARQEKFLMNVGAYKGSIVTRLIHETRPKVMVQCTSLPSGEIPTDQEDRLSSAATSGTRRSSSVTPRGPPAAKSTTV